MTSHFPQMGEDSNLPATPLAKTTPHRATACIDVEVVANRLKHCGRSMLKLNFKIFA